MDMKEAGFSNKQIDLISKFYSPVNVKISKGKIELRYNTDSFIDNTAEVELLKMVFHRPVTFTYINGLRFFTRHFEELGLVFLANFDLLAEQLIIEKITED